MPSTDFSGEPILILSLDEARQLHECIVNQLNESTPLYRKVSTFLKDVDYDTSTRAKQDSP